ncbi:interleukin-1 beta [Sceloporus undulatus]|uniref:interleukin-1 beta n=1 Tax=Sceloporus undulatus TaxID=8520 RepID=UPI001C4D6D2F|nr:interleukin-1 beta [Sceloporus undulatus]
MARVPECQDETMDFCSMNEIEFYAGDHTGSSKDPFPEERSHPACHPPEACELDIQVKISKSVSAKGFQKAAVLVVAIGRMRKNSAARLFSDEDLMDILSTVLEPVDFNTCGITHAAHSAYQFSEDVCCGIQDIAQKSLVLQEAPTELVALHLQGPNISHAVRLKMSVYRPKREAGTDKTPVALNIKGKKLYLSCVLKGGQPVLQLEEASLQGNLDPSALGRFLFFRLSRGGHTRFESAAFPDWFICTSQRSNQAVGLTNRTGQALIVDYDLTD